MTTTLPASAYVSQTSYTSEQGDIFRNSWHLAGPSALLQKPGSYISISIPALPPIVIVRKPDRSLSAFENICRHRAGPLVTEASGSLGAAALTCRYHGWTYRLDGTLAAAPGFDCLPDTRLFPVSVEEWNGLIFVNCQQTPPNFDTWLGSITGIASRYPTMNDMTYVGAIKTSGNCNWKAYADNSCEGWHVPFVHNTLKDNTSEENVEITCHDDGGYVLFDVTYQPTAADPTRMGKAHWIYKFPGLLLHFTDHTINVEAVVPTGPSSIDLLRYFWVDEGKIGKMGLTADDIMSASKVVMDEDVAICETVQSNLESGRYETGVLSAEREPGTVFIQKLVRHALNVS